MNNYDTLLYVWFIIRIITKYVLSDISFGWFGCTKFYFILIIFYDFVSNFEVVH